MIKIYENGPLKVNTYLIVENNKGIVIDPGEDISELITDIEEKNIKIEGILLTHGHLDHVSGVAQLKKSYTVPVYMHKNDESMTRDLGIQSRMLMMKEPEGFVVDTYLEDGDRVELLDSEIVCILIGGHSSGSVCFLYKNALFSGDTLFNYTVGRTDLLGSTSHAELIENIRTKLFGVCDDDTTVYPGHGPATDIGFEKKNNIMLR